MRDCPGNRILSSPEFISEHKDMIDEIWEFYQVTARERNKGYESYSWFVYQLAKYVHRLHVESWGVPRDDDPNYVFDPPEHP